MSIYKEILPKFESVGDNCEFGFVQRSFGVESSGLLRWAVTPPTALTKAISNKFSEIYNFDHLIPSAPKMVRDQRSGLGFHTSMYSQNGVFIHEVEERKSIWEREREKVGYLSDKMNSILESGSKILVYKRNQGASESEIYALATAISMRGPCKLLYVQAEPKNTAGCVRHVRDNLYIGTIDRFAPYDKADDCSYDVWLKVIESMLKVTSAAGRRLHDGTVS